MKTKTGRPRGYAPWRPNAATVVLLAAIDSVLEEYADHWPLSARQVFYRLVAAHGIDKTEKSYDRVLTVLNRARRGERVSWDAIRDDGFSRSAKVGWDSKDDLLAAIRSTAKAFTLDRQQGQSPRLFLWCEAQGMVPQLERVAREYSVPVLSSGGFDSVTVKRSLGLEFAQCGSVLVLHLGDHDPSGVHIFTSLEQDVAAFADGEAERHELPAPRVTFERLAVTPKHVLRYQLPTSPPKPTDNRSFEGVETCQCEALPPDVLARIVRQAMESHIDLEMLTDLKREEVEQRRQLLAELPGSSGG